MGALPIPHMTEGKTSNIRLTANQARSSPCVSASCAICPLTGDSRSGGFFKGLIDEHESGVLDYKWGNC